MSSLRHGRARRLMVSVPLRGTLMFRPPTRVPLLSKRQTESCVSGTAQTATRAVQGAFQRSHNRFPLSRARTSYRKIPHLISLCAPVFVGEAPFDKAAIVSWMDAVASSWQLTGTCCQMLVGRERAKYVITRFEMTTTVTPTLQRWRRGLAGLSMWVTQDIRHSHFSFVLLLLSPSGVICSLHSWVLISMCFITWFLCVLYP